MKHVFIIHSHICYLMAISIINKNKIINSDVIFLTSRGYKPFLTDYKIVNVDDVAQKTSNLNIKKILRIKKQIRIIDNILNSCECDNFCAYIPQMSMLLSQIVVSNKNCNNFIYIEEGLAYYINKNSTECFYNIPIVIKGILYIYNYFSKRIELGHSVFGPFKRFKNPIYYFLKSEFSPKREDVIEIDLMHSISQKTNFNNIKYILVLGANYEYGMVSSIETLRKCYEKIISSMNINDILFVKSHPSTSDITIQLIENIANEKNIQTYFITESIELIMINKRENSENITIGGIDSSLLFYSRILCPKSKIYIGYRFLMEIDKAYRTKSSIKYIEYLFNDKFIHI